MRITVIALAVVLAGCKQSGSVETVESFVTGNDLIGLCASQGAGDRGACRGYVMGVVDEMAQHNGGKALFCAEPSQDDVVATVIASIKAQPTQGHRAASSLVREATLAAFGTNCSH